MGYATASRTIQKERMHMKNLPAQYNPYRGLLSNRLWNSFFGPGFWGEEDESAFLPSVDVIENEKDYCIRAELPGIRKEDVHVNFEGGVLTLSGERKQNKDDKDARYHRVESCYGHFSRSFTLPGDTESDKINAEFKDGVLTVRIPKSKSANPKEIAIQ